MTANKNLAIGEHYMRFIDDQIEQGRFENATEVVQAALRMLEEYDSKMSNLRSMINQAEESIAEGKGVSFTDPQEGTSFIVQRGSKKLTK